MKDSAGTHRNLQELAVRLEMFVEPLLGRLDAQIDKRLVRTFLLSELGGCILSPEQTPAGTKRLSNLLCCGKWLYTLLETYLWQTAQQRATLAAEGQTAYVLWDESVLEKAESWSPEGLCPVRSAISRLGLSHPPLSCFSG